MAPMMSSTRHVRRLFRRYWRTRATGREVPEAPLLYSLSHCLTMMPTDAEDRLRMRPENHRALSQTAQRGTGGAVFAFARVVLEGCVELTNGG